LYKIFLLNLAGDEVVDVLRPMFGGTARPAADGLVTSMACDDTAVDVGVEGVAASTTSDGG
jgi:hypothetical protein